MSFRKNLLLPVVVLAGGFGVWLLAANAFSYAQIPTAQPKTERPATSLRFDASLAHDINELIDSSDAAHARWGLFVISKDGQVRYSRDGDKLFMPASNMKIYTTAVALDLLGSDYRWRTSVYSLKQPDTNGTIDGDLILYGRGAPDFDSKRKESLPALVEQLFARGVRRVRGDIVGDESFFSGEVFGVGWQWNDLQWYYGAEPSALTIDGNAIEITMAPASRPDIAATVVANPNDDYVHLINNTATAERGVVTSIGIQRGLSNNDVRVWGEFPVSGRAFSAFLSVHDPALHAAAIFKRLLIARGIQVDGEVQSRDFRVPENERFNPEQANELGFTESASLSQIVRTTNKESNNLFAELILRTLGKERGATAPDSDPRLNQTRGDDVAGTAVVRKWLSNHGINANILGLNDGSGLSRLDLITPESAARLLMAASQSTWAADFHDSLPIAGRDGTLQTRLGNLSGRIVAKTGTLAYIHSLSGYVTTASGETLAFSIICNDATGPSHPSRVIDSIVVRIAASGTSP